MKTGSVKKNALMNLLLTISSVVFPLITYKYATGVLFPSGIGRVSFANSFISYFSVLAQLGIPTYGIREAARCRNDREQLGRLARELVIIGLGMSFISYLLLFLLILFVPKLQMEKELLLVVSPTILLSTLGMEWLYKGEEDYTYITVRSLCFKVIALAAVLLLVKDADDILIYAALTVFASSASNLMNLFHAGRFVNLKVKGVNLRRHMKPILFFFAMACATTIYTNLDTVMLGFMTDNVNVGYYDAAVKIKNILIWLVTALGTVALPRAAFYAEHGKKEELSEVVRNNFKFVFLTSIPLIIFFFLYAKEIICLISGQEFMPGAAVVRILLPTVLLVGLTNAMGMQILVPTKREKYVLYSVLAGLITDLLLNALLIPVYEIAGAAIATLITEIVVLLVQVFLLRKELTFYTKGTFEIRMVLALIPAAVMVPLCAKLDLNSLISLCVTFAVSGIAYFVSLQFLKVVDLREVLAISDLDLKKPFLFIFAGYVAIRYLNEAMFFYGNVGAQEILNLIKFILTGLILMKLVMDFVNKRLTRQKVLLMLAGGSFLGLTVYLTKVEELLIFWVFICGAHDINHKEICRFAGIAMLTVVVVAFVSSLLGVTENTTLWRSYMGNEHIREGCGFVKPYMAAHFCFFAVVSYLYSRAENVSWMELLFAALLQVAIYMHAKTKNPFVIGIFFTLLCALNKCGLFGKMQRFIRSRKNLAWLGFLIIPCCAAVPFILTVNFDAANETFALLDSVLSHRLELGQNALQTYGFSLFGREIVWSVEENYNIVDSSYINIFVNYGFIFWLLLLSILSQMGYTAGERNDIAFLIALLSIALHSMFDCYLLMLYADLLLLSFSYFGNSPPVLIKGTA